MKNISLSYVVCDKRFFINGHGGKVSHALGIVRGLSTEVQSLSFVVPSNSSDGLSSTLKDVRVNFSLVNVNWVAPIFALLALLRGAKLSDYILVRKNFLTVLLYFLTLGFSFVGGINKRIIWEVNGLSFERYRNTPVLSFLYHTMKILNRVSLRRSVKVYVVSNNIKEELCSGFFKLERDAVIVIPNGSPPVRRRTYTSSDSGYDFIFFGVFRPYNEFELLVQAFKNFNARHANSHRLHFIGFGPELQSLVNLTEKDSSVKVWPAIKPDELLTHSVVKALAVGLVPISSSFGSRFLSPIKLYEYAAIGLPVIMSDVYEGSTGDCHFVYRAGDEESLIKKLESVCNASHQYDELVEVSYKFANENSWRSRMSELLSQI